MLVGKIGSNNHKMKVLYVLVFLTLMPLAFAKLRVGFYKRTCPQAESLIRQSVQDRFGVDKSVTAALLRMHFHDCFVRGCDASILIDSTSNNNPSEKSAIPNLTVREFDLIDQIKSKLEAACPQTVSCADIITLATRDAVVLAGGTQYNVPTGRRDGLVSQANDVNIPGPSSSMSEARQAFATRGLTMNDMVVLLGGHSVGVTHCSFFKDRLNNFNGSGAPDPTMDPSLVSDLKGTCGSGGPNSNPTVFLDRNSSFVFDNQYYKEIMNKKGVLQIDQELALDGSSSKMVSKLAGNNAFFGKSFAKAMVKMGKIQVLQGNAGEIRLSCRRINGPSV